MSPPPAAGDRLRRMLAILPWLTERGQASVQEIATRFEVSPERVVADLELVACCGVSPSPEDLIDVWIDEDDVVHLEVPRYFTQPLRLTARDGFALLAAGRALLSVPGSDPAGSLARALDTLERTMSARAATADGGAGEDTADHPSIEVDVQVPPFLGALQAAVDDHRGVVIDYYSAWRDELTHRAVDPLAVFLADGNWYLLADCHLAGAERRFRVDRIVALEPTGDVFVPRPVDVPLDQPFDPGGRGRRVTLLLAPDAGWVLETYPTVHVTAEPDGRRRVVLEVVGRAWLERLLLRLGPWAEVVEPADLRAAGAAAAARLLARYR
ncbi:MAG: WYL domain-containing protein [Acidimicrobiales bacterium]|nr:WYL domain-containing protein [Acidimicrobiales bacterium]